MSSGHSIWAKHREANESIDLHGLFSDYWSSSSRDFTVLSQSITTNQFRADLIEKDRGCCIGKHRGSIGVRFSANDAVRAFAIAHHHYPIMCA